MSNDPDSKQITSDIIDLVESIKDIASKQDLEMAVKELTEAIQEKK